MRSKAGLFLFLAFGVVFLGAGSSADVPKGGGDLVLVHQDLSNLNPALQAGPS